jgi:MFS family permease
VYLTIASFFRFFGGYSLGFLSATFFIHKYPDNTTQYGYMASVIVIGAGLPASFLGGYLSDKFEDRMPMIKGLISGLGALAACPFIIITYIIQPPFWWAILSYYCAYFLAEMWYGPAHAQINNLFPSQFQGFACAVFNFTGTIAGTIATSVISKLYETYDPEDSDPTNAGYILGAGVLFSYIFAAPFFILSGYEYKKEYEQRKADKIKEEVEENETTFPIE